MPLRIGARFGTYEVTGLLGSGGMGEVYRAHDTNLKRDVALKTLPPALANDADRLARFQREAEVLASLNHPNIAQIYDLERSEGTTALALELIDGLTLEHRLAQGRIPVEEALRIAHQIADGLAAAHERGIVHRDLKPANIKLRPDGTVKVLDFGIAKALDSRGNTGPGPAALTTPAMTEAGIILGTAAYMSPEQARGRAVDRRADIWAFGCVLYEMLTGRAAFLGDDVTSTLARVLEASTDFSALPSNSPASVRRTLELCFEKDARKRIADMSDVRLGLAGAFAATAPTLATVQPLWRRALPFAATLVVGSLLASAYFLGFRPAAPAGMAARITRFVITPPATAPLANQGSIDLSISPDGRRIAYLAVKPESGRVELHVRELDALEARPIPSTEARNVGLWNPFFSPDGMSIGYVAPDRGLVSVSIDGRPPVRIAEGPDPFFGAWWAADNTVIYSTPLTLQRVSAAGGGTPVPLMPERQGGAAVGGPGLLPGGRAVLFHVVGGAAEGRRVAALDLATGQEKTLIEGGSFPVYVDTGHIVFFLGNTLMAVPFSASELAVTGEQVALVERIRWPSGGAPDFALSANGTLAYVPEAVEETSDLAVVWVDRTGNVTGRAVPDLVTNPRDPTLSPDDRRLLLVTGSEDDGDLWNYDLSGRPPIPLALPNDNAFPAWSPDGTQVAFHTLPLNATVALLADGSERAPQSLSTQLYLRPYAWSAAGELVVTRLTNRGDIAAIPVAAAAEVRDVAASDSSELSPALSSNGRWLAYVSDRSQQNEIWVQRYPEGAPVRVSSGSGYEPRWSADGRELFYRQGDAVMAVAVEAGDEFSFGEPKALFSGPFVRRVDARSYDVARDGRFLMILSGEENRAAAPGTIIVVQNFGEELKQRVRPSGT